MYHFLHLLHWFTLNPINLQALNIGFTEDSVDPRMHAIALRLSYLISEQLTLAGNTSYIFQVESDLKSLDLPAQVRFLKVHDTEASPQSLQWYEDFPNVYKQMLKNKNKQKQDIVNFKKLEHSTNNLFQLVAGEFLEKVKSTGLVDLKELMEKDNFSLYHVHYKRPEAERDDQSTLSMVMQLELDAADAVLPTVFFLNYNYFSDNGGIPPPFTAPAADEFSANGFITRIFTTNNLNLFTVAQLDVLKMYTRLAGEKFNRHFDRFISMADDPAAAFEYLNHELKQSAQELQTELDNNELIKNCWTMEIMENDGLELFAGMVTRQNLFEYFSYSNVIKEETAKLLEEWRSSPGLVPVLILKIVNWRNIPGSTKIQQKETFVPVLKKSLEI